MNFIYWIVFDVFILGNPLIFYLHMKVIDILSHQANLFSSSSQILYYFREGYMTLIRL